jgi:hypothetical protein
MAYETSIIGYISKNKYKSVISDFSTKEERLAAKKIFSDSKYHLNNYSSSLVLTGDPRVSLDDVSMVVEQLKEMAYCRIFSITSFGYEKIKDSPDKNTKIDIMYVEIDAESG